MKIFKVTENIEVVCESEKTRNGFRHLANLIIDGNDVDTAKCCYINRTWESYEFQSVLQKLFSKTTFLTEEQKKICLEFANGNHTDYSAFKTTSLIAGLGNLFCDNQKDQNDWKTRMLKAGLGNAGLEIPEDWDTLDEDTKTARLDAVIKLCGEKEIN